MNRFKAAWLAFKEPLLIEVVANVDGVKISVGNQIQETDLSIPMQGWAVGNKIMLQDVPNRVFMITDTVLRVIPCNSMTH